MTETQTVSYIPSDAAFDAPDWSDDKWAESARGGKPQHVANLWTEGEGWGDSAGAVETKWGEEPNGTLVGRAVHKVKDTAELTIHVANSLVPYIVHTTFSGVGYLVGVSHAMLDISIHSTAHAIKTAIEIAKQLAAHAMATVVSAVVFACALVAMMTGTALRIVGIDVQLGKQSIENRQ
ncbi:hypothetical protein HDV00_003506 [Rhizophlyctis rosea]|nr:hypothetical protein HDV00_003506 [Rhizophlyctis rosea]